MHDDEREQLPDLDPTTAHGYHAEGEESGGTDDDVARKPRRRRRGPTMPGEAASGGGGPISGILAGERFPKARDDGLDERRK